MYLRYTPRRFYRNDFLSGKFIDIEVNRNSVASLSLSSYDQRYLINLYKFNTLRKFERTHSFQLEPGWTISGGPSFLYLNFGDDLVYITQNGRQVYERVFNQNLENTHNNRYQLAAGRVINPEVTLFVDQGEDFLAMTDSCGFVFCS